MLCGWCADAIPIFIRLINNKNFEPGPFCLGALGVVISWIAVIWVCFITVRAFPYHISWYPFP